MPSGYRAPELADYIYDASGRSQAGTVTRKGDIWAVRCILFKLATTGREPAFANHYEAVAFTKKHEGFILPQLEEWHNESLTTATLCPARHELIPL